MPGLVLPLLGAAGDRGGAVVQRQGRRRRGRPHRYSGLYWCVVGLVIAIAASGIAKRVGESLVRRTGPDSRTARPSEHALRARRSRHRGHREAALLPARGGVRPRLDARRPPTVANCSTCRRPGRPAASGTATRPSSRRSAGRCARRQERAGCRPCIPIRWAWPKTCSRSCPAAVSGGSTWGTRDPTPTTSRCGPAGTRRGTRTVLAFEHSYHGGVGVAMGVSGVHVDAGAPPDPDAVFLPYPNPFRPSGDGIDADVTALPRPRRDSIWRRDRSPA